MATTSDDRQRRQLQALLDHLAAEDVPELIHQARLEARARVKEILTQAFVEAMLARAGTTETEELSVPAETPAKEDTARETPPAAEKVPETGEGLYILCVTAASTPLPDTVAGINDTPPRRIVHDELAAVVCPVPLAEFGEEELRAHLQDMAWLERVARTHEEALERISDETTLIPMRLCTVYRAESGVREMLMREEQPLRQALRHLEGKREWGVKVFAAAPDAQAQDEPAPEGGADYMRRRQQERDRRLRRHGELDQACVEIHERLSAAADDSLTNPPQRQEVSGHGGEMVLNGVYLVDDDRLSEFLELVGGLRDQFESLGLEIEPTGPWPAYNFVPGTIGAAW